MDEPTFSCKICGAVSFASKDKDVSHDCPTHGYQGQAYYEFVCATEHGYMGEASNRALAIDFANEHLSVIKPHGPKGCAGGLVIITPYGFPGPKIWVR